MGLFKQMKQMKEVVAEAPDLVRNAMAMQEAQNQAAQAAMAAATAPTSSSTGAASVDDEAIAGVSLATYAAVCRTGTQRGVSDLPGVAAIARESGIDAASWNTAMNGWNARFATDTNAAMRFNALWKNGN